MKQSTLLTVLLLALYSCSARALPITDTVTAYGNEWAQPALFVNRSWNDINTVCPGGVCGSGNLGGYDMAGWSWASLEEVFALFNRYLMEAGVSGSDLLDPGIDSYSGDWQTSWATAFYADGWWPTFGISSSARVTTAGWTASDTSSNQGYIAVIHDLRSSTLADLDFVTSTTWVKTGPGISRGAWFFRDAIVEIPIPSSMFLAALALLMLLRFNRNPAGE